jgi:hypothetical protein
MADAKRLLLLVESLTGDECICTNVTSLHLSILPTLLVLRTQARCKENALILFRLKAKIDMEL